MSSNLDQEKLSKEMQARQKRLEQVRKMASWIGVMTSTIAISITISMAFGWFFDKTKILSREELSAKITAIGVENQGYLADIASMKKELSEIKKSVSTISSLPKGSEWKIETSKISTQVNKISMRLDALESALTVDPSKALAIPILRKDLDTTEKALRAELTQTRSEIDRIYDQNKWFMGLMFTIALSVLGMAVNSIFNRKDA